MEFLVALATKKLLFALLVAKATSFPGVFPGHRKKECTLFKKIAVAFDESPAAGRPFRCGLD